MTIASEFYDMAVEMLSDAEIGFDGTVSIKTQTANPDKPWDPLFTNENVSIRLFYTTQSTAFVNGSPVLKGEKVFICYAPEGYNFNNLDGCKFTDHTGRVWTINSIEPVGAGGQDIIFYLKIGV